MLIVTCLIIAVWMSTHIFINCFWTIFGFQFISNSSRFPYSAADRNKIFLNIKITFMTTHWSCVRVCYVSNAESVINRTNWWLQFFAIFARYYIGHIFLEIISRIVVLIIEHVRIVCLCFINFQFIFVFISKMQKFKLEF